MSDEAVVVPGPVAPDVTAGRLLRQAREATGLHIAALAVSLKVPVKKLEALEADRLEELPDAVFVRALAASMCRTLKVDAAPILSKLPQSLAPKLDKNDRGISMPAQGPGFLTANALMAFVSRPAVLLVAGLLLAALAVALFPQARSTVGMAESALGSVAVPMAAAPPVAADAAAAAPASNTRAAEPAPSPEIQPVAPVAAPVQATVPAAALASGSPAASPTASAPASGLLVFKASASAWIRVSDSHGVVQFEKTLAAGETAAASGVPPLAVVVGNVAATEVLLRGQPFKMQDLNQNNVARFEVK